MYYIFVINGRGDKSSIAQKVKDQLKGLDIRYELYVTKGMGDGTRFVRIYCDLHEKAEVCFVACGGSGTINEVASGIVGFKNKSMAILALGGTADFCKYYPDRDFTDFRKVLSGEEKKVDIMKVNDFYSLNVINIGFDAAAAIEADRIIKEGGKNPYTRGVFKATMVDWFNRIKVVADGKKISRYALLLCPICNGQWTGGSYHCAPQAINDDGLMDICLIRTMSIFYFLYFIGKFTKGLHINDKICQKKMTVCRASHVDVSANHLIFISLDGEIMAGRNFSIDILKQEINLVLPSIS